jgi:hypothetical protein
MPTERLAEESAQRADPVGAVGAGGALCRRRRTGSLLDKPLQRASRSRIVSDFGRPCPGHAHPTPPCAIWGLLMPRGKPRLHRSCGGGMGLRRRQSPSAYGDSSMRIGSRLGKPPTGRRWSTATHETNSVMAERRLLIASRSATRWCCAVSSEEACPSRTLLWHATTDIGPGERSPISPEGNARGGDPAFCHAPVGPRGMPQSRSARSWRLLPSDGATSWCHLAAARRHRYSLTRP